MNNKTKGLIAAAAGAALLTTGGTFALWTQSNDVAGGDIVSGQFGVISKQVGFFDTSNDRSDAKTATGVVGDPTVAQGHAIDLMKWETVPGDTVLGVYTIDGKLSGENLVARLDVTDQSGNPIANVTNSDGDKTSVSTTDGYTIKYALTDAAGNLLDPKTGFSAAPDVAWVSSPTAIKFASTNNTNNVAELPTMDNQEGTTDYKVAVKVTFTAENQDLQQAKQTLSGMKIGLSQERAEAAGQGGF